MSHVHGRCRLRAGSCAGCCRQGSAPSWQAPRGTGADPARGPGRERLAAARADRAHRRGRGTDAGHRRGRGQLLSLLLPAPGRSLSLPVERQRHRPHAWQPHAGARTVSPARRASRPAGGRGRARQRRFLVVHRPGRPGPGAARQPAPGADAHGRSARRRTGRPGARPCAGGRLARRVAARRSAGASRRHAAGRAAAAGPGAARRAGARCRGHARRDRNLASCAAAAAPASPPRPSGVCASAHRWRRAVTASSSAMPTRASPAPSRTACC